MERNDEKREPKELAHLLALADAERRYYQDIVAALPVGLIVLSMDLSILSFNRSILQIFGVQGQESLRGRLDELQPQGLDNLVREVLKTGIPHKTRVMLADPRSGRHVRVGIQPLRHFGDSPQEALLTFEDVTEVGRPIAAHKTIDATLAAAEIIENLGAAVWVAKIPEMRFVFVNKAGQILLGFDVAHWLNDADFWSGRVYPDDRERLLKTYREALSLPASDGTMITCEYRALTSRNSARWLYETAQVSGDAKGRPQYLIGVSIDVTQRRLLERQSVQSNRRNAIGRLAGRLIHDLNNLLMIVTGYSEELMASFPDNSPLREDIRQILRAGERVGALTSQLLTLNRSRPASPTMIDLGGTLQGMEINLRDAAGDNIVLKLEPVQHRITVKADLTHVQKVVGTLAQRARKVMPGGGILSIGIERTAITGENLPSDAPLPPGEYAVVAVRDDGPQYDHEARAGLFESFLPDDERDQEIGPLLSEAYALARQWGGDISVEAASPKGEMFRIFLPIVPDDVPARISPVDSKTGAEKGTILVVDDEEGIRLLIGKILRHQGFRVLEAGDGQNAIEMFRAQRMAVSLVIADVAMPEMNGPELITHLQRFQDDIKVLYISGYTADSTLRVEDLPPGTAFLRKPFTLAALLEKVKEMIAVSKTT